MNYCEQCGRKIRNTEIVVVLEWGKSERAPAIRAILSAPIKKAVHIGACDAQYREEHPIKPAKRVKKAAPVENAAPEPPKRKTRRKAA